MWDGLLFYFLLLFFFFVSSYPSSGLLLGIVGIHMTYDMYDPNLCHQNIRSYTDPTTFCLPT